MGCSLILWLSSSTTSLPCGARLHARTSPSQGHFNTIEAQVALLSHAGFSPVEAVALLMTLGRFIVGVGP
ncbi:TetR/AcrR family transcriptional regulator C-terminal domain-containing protein [Acinetobacter baumannii]|uniref:TetR/AcrR family transcriptional regulator C-terminal domain-containing protein n=1 Tax=Acinetobacter baumannii TaxID=470 RepID=UPI0038CD828C